MDPATDDSKTPIAVLNLLPRAIVQVFHPGLHKTDNGVADIINARYITLIFSVLTLCLVFTWAGACFGEKSGLFAAFLLALEPSFLANSGLVTTDSYSAFFLLAVCYSLWKCLRLRTWRWLIIFSLAVAGAQLVKQSLLHLYLLLPIIIVAHLVAGRRPSVSTLLKALLVFLVIQWLVINVGYYFFGTNTPLGDYHFFSDIFRQIQHSLPAGLPIPFPRPFVQAFDMTKYYDEIGGGIAAKSGFGNVTVLGHSFTGRGVWYYYFVSLFFKAPVTLMVLFGWALGRAVINKFPDRTTVICLLLPAGYFLIYFSFFTRSRSGSGTLFSRSAALCVPE